MATFGDPWIISADDRAKYDSQFFQLHPVAGFITGEQAKRFFMMSGLPTPILGQIWMLADVNADGKMDRREFGIAMFLIKKKLQGFELPPTLPLTLLSDTVTSAPLAAPSVMGPFGSQPMATGFMPSNLPVMAMSGPPVMSPLPAGGFSTGPAVGYASPSKTSFNSSGSSTNNSGEWIIPQSQRLKYKQVFNSHDPSHKGFLTGMEAKAILSQSGLVHTTLAQIWSLSDIDVDGHLSVDEFCVAMYLIDLAKMGQPVPATLPAGLVPPSYRRLRRMSETSAASTIASNAGPSVGSMPAKTDAFGELLGGLGVGTTGAVSADFDPKALEADGKGGLVTFEDRRKENFEKGQAELERRRAALREQQQREEEARVAAEKAEQEKRERLRQEQEMKKQMEFEKQIEKQRQLEMEREEQRRKAMEQREAARRELELQRQLEWERQRRDQLMAEMQREHTYVDKLRLELGQSKLELTSVTTKLEELTSRIDQLRHSVADFSASIDAMRISRDAKIAEMERSQNDVQEWNHKLSMVQQERIKLSQQLMSQNPLQDDETKRIAQSCRSKRENVDRLKSELSTMEKQAANVQRQIDSYINELDDLNNQLRSLQKDNQSLEGQLGSKKSEWESRKSKTPSSMLDGPHDKQSTPVRLQSNKYDWDTSQAESFGTAVDWQNVSTSTKNSSDVWGKETSAFPSNGPTNAWSPVSVPSSNAATTTAATTNGWASFGISSDPFGEQPAPSAAVDSSAWMPAGSSTGAKHGTKPVTAASTEPPPGYRKYVALYEFAARNFDELNLKVGDEVWVRLDRTGIEPEWLFGKLGGKEGLFPEAFALPAEETSSSSETKFSTKIVDGGLPSNSLYDALPKSSVEPSPPPVQATDASQAAQPLTASAKSSFDVVPPSAPSPTPGQRVQMAPEGTLVEALYPWLAKKDNHLTFAKGDIIAVKEQQDMWWSGELNGKIGWFPKSYVKVISEENTYSMPKSNAAVGNWTANFESEAHSSATQSPATKLPTTNIVATITVSPATTTQSTPKSPTVSGPQELCVAMYSYTSNVPGDLTFNQGDVITIVKSEGDWWTGTKDGQTGCFPANYVKKMEPSTKSMKKTRAPPAPSTLPHLDPGHAQKSYDTNSLPRQGAQKIASGRKPEIATVIAPYQATGPEQLSLQPGQLIDVRKKNPSGWWEGELQARGQKRRIGWFPANYVKLLANSACTTPDKSATMSPRPQSADPVGRSSSPVSFPAPTATPSMEQVIALYKYQKQNPDELDFEKGSVINVINKLDADWWMGELNSKSGLFPSNYVAPLSTVTDGSLAVS